MKDELGDILKRVERLERENRGLKRAGFLTLVGFAAIVLMGQAAPKSRTVEAEKFVLKDASGKVRAEMGPRDDLMGLSIYDENGKRRGIFAVRPDGWGELGFLDQDEKYRATLKAQDDQVVLLFSDAKGGNAMLLTAGGSPILSLADKKGKSTAWLQAVSGQPMLMLTDEEKKVDATLSLLHGWARLSLSSNEKGDATLGIGMMVGDGSPYLNLSGKDSKGAAILELEKGSPSLTLSDENGKARAVLGHTALEVERTGTVEQRPALSLVLFDKEGKVIWRTP